MFTDNSTSTKLPKTLIIRNHLGGMIWQIYHIVEEVEAEVLSATAAKDGFGAITLEDHRPNDAETFPTWRADCEWAKKI